MLHLDDRWIWDFWLIDDGPDHHVFYLQAPRSLGDPERRHRHATIGHAVSTDLATWTVLPDALGPGEAGAWDDNAPWTGSIIRAADRWHLCYTGTSSADGGLIQRIGIAVSDDLIQWERPVDHPVIDADHRWYERFGDSDWFDEAWRDPWLTTDPRSGERWRSSAPAFPTAGPTNEGPSASPAPSTFATGRPPSRSTRPASSPRWKYLK